MDKLSVWLLPPKKVQAVYRLLTVPTFEPHITLISDAAGKAVTKAVVKNIKPIPIELTEVSVSTTYFQCVFARVKPTWELLWAHQLVKSALRHPDPSMYVPHMSLVYSNISLEKRFALAQKIKLPITRFTADRISIVDTDKLNPKYWKRLTEFKL